MRLVVLTLLLAGTVDVARPAGQAQTTAPPPAGEPVATVAELMGTILYPNADAVFYISSRTPKTPAEWVALEQKTLMLAETANLLTMPARARDQGQWLKDAQLLRDAGREAYRAAKARDVEALAALNDKLYLAGVQCHVNYRPNFRRPRSAPPPPQGN